MKPNDVTKSDHEFIWLEPKNHDNGEEGRIWCQDDVWSSECIGEECGGPTKYVRSDLYDAVYQESIELRAEAATKMERIIALESKLQHWRTDEPPRSVLLLTWVRGVKEHSGAMWTREGYWLMPWHGEDGWAAQFRNAACKHLDADTLDVVGWMPLPEPPSK